MVQEMRNAWIVGILSFLTGSMGVAHADVIAYTNLNNNGAYAYPNFTGSGTIGGPFRTEAAFEFTPTVTGDITQIRLALGTNFNINNGSVTLYGDDMSYPDPALLTLTLAGVPTFDPTNAGNNPLALTVLKVNGGKRGIVAGKSYWLSVAPGPPNASGDPNLLSWFDNSSGATSLFAQRTDPPQRGNDFVVFGRPGTGSPPLTMGAFEVQVAVAAPEPASVAQLIAGFLGLVLIRCWRSPRLAPYHQSAPPGR
jgi:hypothetical protein